MAAVSARQRWRASLFVFLCNFLSSVLSERYGSSAKTLHIASSMRENQNEYSTIRVNRNIYEETRKVNAPGRFARAATTPPGTATNPKFITTVCMLNM